MYFVLFSALLGILAFNTKLAFLVFIAAVPLFLFFIYEKSLFKLLIGSFLFRLIFLYGVVYFVTDPILYFFSVLIFLGLPLSFYLVRKYFSLFVAVAVLPVLWTVFDYLAARYSLLPTAVAMLGNPLANSLFIGLAKINGIVGLTFFAALINLLFLSLLLLKKDRKLLIGFIALIFVLAGTLSCFLIKGNKGDYLSKGRKLEAVLISASKNRAEFDNFWVKIFIEPGTDLVAIPEDFYFKSNPEDFNKAIDFYSQAARGIKTNLSAVLSQKDGNRLYKSSILFSGDGKIKSVYNKNYLTITSENWPFKDWRPFYFNAYLKSAPEEEKKKAIFDSHYQYSTGGPSLLKGDGFSFANPICGELHYPDYMEELNSLNPDFILHNSENDWIERGLKQYLVLTNNLRKIEAVHFGKPVLVNGIADYAGIFYPDGTSNLIYPEKDIVLFNAEVLY